MARLTISQSLAPVHNIFIMRREPREFYDSSLDDFAAGLTADEPVVNYYLVIINPHDSFTIDTLSPDVDHSISHYRDDNDKFRWLGRAREKR